ncbi:MAG: hypothetical protein LBM41_00880 [Ruminococcus sp.]|jgi:hypothetical protein|nr:hypothetical protein [Ruminococcus sp.]
MSTNKKKLNTGGIYFMTAYKLTKINKKFSLFKRKPKLRSLLSSSHISMLCTPNMIFRPNCVLNYTTEYNHTLQDIKFQFTPKDKNFDENVIDNEINEVLNSRFLFLKQSINIVLNSDLLQIDCFYEMYPFMVKINDKLFQVDSIVYVIDFHYFVVFELLDYETGVPIHLSDVYGRHNNYNIIPVNEIKYFNETDFRTDSRDIAQIIFDNVINLLPAISRSKVDSFSILHNYFVINDGTKNVETLFKNVLGAQINDLKLKNLSSVKDFEYYSHESMGIVDKLNSETAVNTTSDCMILESLKMYCLLNQFVDYDITTDLDEMIDNQVRLEAFIGYTDYPIITLNLISNIKSTQSYINNKANLEFKINYFRILQERQRNKNSVLLNILLYVLSYISCIGTLQVLQTEFKWSFLMSFIVVTVVFVILGLIWLIRETKK